MAIRVGARRRKPLEKYLGRLRSWSSCSAFPHGEWRLTVAEQRKCRVAQLASWKVSPLEPV